jgi:hypothetical protein
MIIAFKVRNSQFPVGWKLRNAMNNGFNEWFY